MYEIELEFQEGWAALTRNAFCGGGMDNLWNYTINYFLHKQGKKLSQIIKELSGEDVSGVW